MNKWLLVYILLVFSSIANAQLLGYKQERPKSKNNNHQNQASAFANNKRVVKHEKIADKIINALFLSDSEARIINNLCEERAEKIEKIKLNSDNSQQKIIDLQAVNQDFDAKIKQLVTTAQYQKYEALRKNGN